jgi:hypothetical protein
VAIDGTGRNSPYAQALLRYIEAPGKDVSGVLISVRNDVLQATDGRQVPWEHTSLTGQVYLKVALPNLSGAAHPPPPASSNNYDKEIELSYWSSVKDSKSPALIQSYLDRYPNGNFASLARAMIGELTPPGASAPLGNPPPAAGDKAELVRSLQTELRRVGCDPGAVDGKWQSRTREALTDFAQYAKLSLQTEKPSTEALNAVKERTHRVCPLECGSGKTEVDGRCVAKTSPTPSAKHKSTDAPARAARRANKDKSGGGTCWADAPGRGFEFVPCSDPRARQKAF